MPSQIPKPAHLRQRRNKTSTHATLNSDEPARKRAPSLPHLDGIEWHKMTRTWWREVWHSPMASEYLDADVEGLNRLAVLVNQFWCAPDIRLACEIRLQQQAFGLTPIDRRRLQWEVGRVENTTTKRRSMVDAPERPENYDPRQVLKVLEK